MPGFREVMRCARCGNVFTDAIAGRFAVQAVRRRSALVCAVRVVRHRQAVRVRADDPARISPKDARNTCELFSPRVTVERETHSQAQPSGAQQRAQSVR